ncbi:MAG: hypothetical protein ACI8W8_001736 [Rhodothermales bacterium]|jgi:hypothetical protein
MYRRDFLKMGSTGLVGASVLASLQVTGCSSKHKPFVFEAEATDELLLNPGIGLETFYKFNNQKQNGQSYRPAENHPKCSISYIRSYWDEMEPREGQYNFTRFDNLLEKAEANDQELAFRFMGLCQAHPAKGTPNWFREKGKGFSFKSQNKSNWAPDYNDSGFLSRQEEMISAFGERYNGHRHFSRMEIGHVGFWGEWHTAGSTPRVPMISERNARNIFDAYLKYWDKTPLQALIGYVPGLRYAVQKGIGWRADSFGDYGLFSKNWNHMRDTYPRNLEEADALDVWKQGPVGFEVSHRMQDLEKVVPNRDGGYDAMWDQAFAWHASTFNAKGGPILDSQLPGLNRFLKRCGYRIALRHFVASPAIASSEKHFPVTMEFENTGVAPPYKDYVLAIKLSGGTDPIILKSNTKTREWLPGTHQVNEELLLPETLSAGSYEIAISLLDPSDLKPAIRLANKGLNEDRWFPLGNMQIL